MTRLEAALVRLAADLDELGASFALVGGLALSVRAEPRTTVTSEVEFPVARTGHLIALKVLAGRDQDLVDARTLLRFAEPADLELARGAIEAIAKMGLDRGIDLAAALAKLVASRAPDS